MSELGKKLAVANFNSGRCQISADLCTPPTDEATEIRIKTPSDNVESYFYELSNLGLAPKDVVVWSREGAYDPETPAVKDLADIGYGRSDRYGRDDIDEISLTKEGVQKLVSAGVRHPVLEAFAEHHHMKQPKLHSEKLK